jgi:hypothetical protein
MQQMEQNDDQRSANTGANEISAINAADGPVETLQRQRKKIGEKKERQCQNDINHCKQRPLVRIPQNLEGIERNALRDEEAGERRGHERRAVGEVDRAVSVQQPHLANGDERPARAETEQRDADDHVRKMMPMDDRKEPHEQDFVGEARRREEQDRKKRRARRAGSRLRWRLSVHRSAARTSPEAVVRY